MRHLYLPPFAYPRWHKRHTYLGKVSHHHLLTRVFAFEQGCPLEKGLPYSKEKKKSIRWRSVLSKKISFFFFPSLFLFFPSLFLFFPCPSFSSSLSFFSSSISFFPPQFLFFPILFLFPFPFSFSASRLRAMYKYSFA